MLLRFGALMLVMFLLLAGCSGDESADVSSTPTQTGAPAGGAPGAGGAASGNASVAATFAQEYTLTLTQAMVAGFGHGDDNCVIFPGADLAEVHGGTVNATWTAATPEEMQLEVGLAGAPAVASAGPGPSPLSVVVPTLVTDGADFYVRLGLPDGTGAQAQREVALAIQFQYLGAAGLAGALGPC